MTMPAVARSRAKAPASRTASSGRDLYLDLLRALALVRVVAYHQFGWAWLTLMFPSMGVMFALAGSLMARSLQRPAIQVIRSRMRRLLVPMWLFGIVVVAGMLQQGWGPSSSGDPTRWWVRMFFWVVPISDPPFDPELPGIKGLLEGSWADQVAVPLWYLRAYLWFVLLSPLMLRAFRRKPWLTILTPLGVAILLGSGVIDVPGRIGDALTDFAVFGACWLLGFAHREGVLQRMPRYVVPSITPFILLIGLWWATSHPDPETGYDLDDLPMAQAIWSFGYVMLLLYLSPSWTSWPPRLRRWGGVVSLLNARAITVYLWHNFTLIAATQLIDPLWDIPVLELHFAWLLDSAWVPFLLCWPLLALCIVMFGWVEDVAAKRRPQLFPWPRKAKAGRQ